MCSYVVQVLLFMCVHYCSWGLIQPSDDVLVLIFFRLISSCKELSKMTEKLNSPRFEFRTDRRYHSDQLSKSAIVHINFFFRKFVVIMLSYHAISELQKLNQFFLKVTLFLHCALSL